MAATDPIVLPDDIVIAPVATLPSDTRRQFEYEEGDFAITRSLARSGSKIVSPMVARLLTEFRKPKTIVDAVLSFSKASGQDPEAALEQAFPLIQRLCNEDFLVAAGSHLASASSHMIPGTQVDGFKVLRKLQILDDSEVCKVVTEHGALAVIKMARDPKNRAVAKVLLHEARVLAHLDGTSAPRLLGEGQYDGRDYIAVEWCDGVHVAKAAAELRAGREATARVILQLCHGVARAYADLHARGVLHGDVHLRNVLVDNGRVRLIDFGLARADPEQAGIAEPSRGGVGFFFEPEYAAASGHRRPRVSQLGEQYSLAALLYFCATGVHYLDFALERRRMFEQIARSPMLSFAHHGLAPWPALEAVLARALAKAPSERYGSVAELADAISEVSLSASSPVLRRVGRAAKAEADGGRAYRDELLQELMPDGDLLGQEWATSPTCSINYGFGGIAYYLYRAACLQDDPRLLSAADLWINRALREAASDGAFYNLEMGISRETVGHRSIFHSSTGLHCVQGLIAQAMGDFASLQPALDAFVTSANQVPCDKMDLTLGRGSLLLGSAALLEAVPTPHRFVRTNEVRELGARLLNELWSALEPIGPIAAQAQIPLLGIAHGWAGFLFSILRFCVAAGLSPPVGTLQRLQELAECGSPLGDRTRWPRKVHSVSTATAPEFLPGWCNGSSGFVHLWLLAFKVFCDPLFAELAKRAALDAWSSVESFPTICCGSAGRAYAMLAMYRETGDGEWLQRATALCCEAAAGCRTSEVPRYGLYKGGVGVALLATDLMQPARSCLPLCEPEG